MQSEEYWINLLCEIPCSNMMAKDRKKENIVRQTSTDEDVRPNKNLTHFSFRNETSDQLGWAFYHANKIYNFQHINPHRLDL